MAISQKEGMYDLLLYTYHVKRLWGKKRNLAGLNIVLGCFFFFLLVYYSCKNADKSAVKCQLKGRMRLFFTASLINCGLGTEKEQWRKTRAFNYKWRESGKGRKEDIRMVLFSCLARQLVRGNWFVLFSDSYSCGCMKTKNNCDFFLLIFNRFSSTLPGLSTSNQIPSFVLDSNRDRKKPSKLGEKGNRLKWS